MIPNEDGGHRQVCRKTSMDVFVIMKKQIEVMARKKRSGDPTFIDNRGGSYHRKYTDKDRQNAIYHIQQIPRDISHYSRRDTKEFPNVPFRKPRSDTYRTSDRLAIESKGTVAMKAKSELAGHHATAQNVDNSTLKADIGPDSRTQNLRERLSLKHNRC